MMMIKKMEMMMIKKMGMMSKFFFKFNLSFTNKEAKLFNV
jgi:hypothetical protein